jgi:pyruvate carboxylase
MRRALAELEIEGIKTTVPFCLLVLEHPEFINGRFNINFVENYWAELQQISRNDKETVEIIAAAIAFNRDNQTSFNSKAGVSNASLPALSPWKMRVLKEAMRTK